MSMFVQTGQQGSVERLQRHISKLRDIEKLLIRLAGPQKADGPISDESPPEVQEVLSEVHDEITRSLALKASKKQASSSHS
ncbi:MAG TPA: hypothetical protein VKP65_26105 [Rhodothermales bacterium]|nr:hypothetical protein [Rhodothermales bacterium]